jgi:predicted HNH restriction endonuclease
MFFGALGQGRTLSAFQNSLKNARDAFDAHVDSGRVGWRQPGSARAPGRLGAEAAGVLRKWGNRAEDEVWEAVRHLADRRVIGVEPSVISDMEAELDPAADSVASRTEGRQRVVISARAERDPALRGDALRVHRAVCMACGFDFGAVYGEWGNGFAEVHHVRPLADGDGERETDPRRDLAVLCANCHRMVHRRRGITLSLEELKGKLRRPPRPA